MVQLLSTDGFFESCLSRWPSSSYIHEFPAKRIDESCASRCWFYINITGCAEKTMWV